MIIRTPFYRWEGSGDGTLPRSGLTGARMTMLSPTSKYRQAQCQWENEAQGSPVIAQKTQAGRAK